MSAKLGMDEPPPRHRIVPIDGTRLKKPVDRTPMMSRAIQIDALLIHCSDQQREQSNESDFERALDI
jgi:hypothetical protein